MIYYYVPLYVYTYIYIYVCFFWGGGGGGGRLDRNVKAAVAAKLQYHQDQHGFQ